MLDASGFKIIQCILSSQTGKNWIIVLFMAAIKVVYTICTSANTTLHDSYKITSEEKFKLYQN